MERMCFQLQIRPEGVTDYVRSHERVWPEMLVALRDSGWRNYSLFLGADGLLIGYFEADSVSTALTAMSQQDVNKRWQSAMSGMIVDADLHRLPEVFNLGEQLRLASSSIAGSVEEAAPSEPSSSRGTSPGLSRPQPPRSDRE